MQILLTLNCRIKRSNNIQGHSSLGVSQLPIALRDVKVNDFLGLIVAVDQRALRFFNLRPFRQGLYGHGGGDQAFEIFGRRVTVLGVVEYVLFNNLKLLAHLGLGSLHWGRTCVRAWFKGLCLCWLAFGRSLLGFLFGGLSRRLV